MNCREFEERLPILMGNPVSGPLWRDALLHASGCPRCELLLSVARGESDAGDGSIDLTRSIMQRTSGDVCSGIAERLADFADGTLPQLDIELVSEHLEHCTPCSDLVAAIQLLRQELPRLAEIEPDTRFVLDVIERTTRQASARRSTLESLLAEWKGLLQRPRIALELAYCGAMLIFILGGSPAPFIERVSSRNAQLSPGQGVAVLGDILRADRALDRVGALIGTVPGARRLENERRQLAKLVRRGAGVLTALGRTVSSVAIHAIDAGRAVVRDRSVEIRRTPEPSGGRIGQHRQDRRDCRTEPGAEPGTEPGTEPEVGHVRNSRRQDGERSP